MIASSLLAGYWGDMWAASCISVKGLFFIMLKVSTKDTCPSALILCRNYLDISVQCHNSVLLTGCNDYMYPWSYFFRYQLKVFSERWKSTQKTHAPLNSTPKLSLWKFFIHKIVFCCHGIAQQSTVGFPVNNSSLQYQ